MAEQGGASLAAEPSAAAGDQAATAPQQRSSAAKTAFSHSVAL